MSNDCPKLKKLREYIDYKKSWYRLFYDQGTQYDLAFGNGYLSALHFLEEEINRIESQTRSTTEST